MIGWDGLCTDQGTSSSAFGLAHALPPLTLRSPRRAQRVRSLMASLYWLATWFAVDIKEVQGRYRFTFDTADQCAKQQAYICSACGCSKQSVAAKPRKPLLAARGDPWAAVSACNLVQWAQRS